MSVATTFVLVFSLLFLSATNVHAVYDEGKGVTVQTEKYLEGVDEDPEARRKMLGNAESPKLARAKAKNSKKNARIRVMADAAQTLGFQEGFAWKHKQLFRAAMARSREFDRTFDFRRLLIDEKVLPPVIRWSGPAMTLESNTTATEVEAQYRIISPARIVSTAPTWQSYLMADTEILKPDDAIYPRNGEEREFWREAIDKGWAEGEEHAKDVFEMGMDKLVSDFRGILRFRMLVEQGLVSVPVLAKGDLGIQIGGNIMNMDQKTFRITVPASFRRIEQSFPEKPMVTEKTGKKSKSKKKAK